MLPTGTLASGKRLNKALTGGNHASDGVAAWEHNSATVYRARWRVGRVEIWTGMGDQGAATGRAGDAFRGIGDLGMALMANPIHRSRLHPTPLSLLHGREYAEQFLCCGRSIFNRNSSISG
jgi:hypothetical protein